MGGDGAGALSLSDPGFDHFFGDFWIRCHNADSLGVSSNFENSRFLSQISESTNPPFFRNFSAQTKILDRGGAGYPTLFLKLCHMVHIQK